MKLKWGHSSLSMPTFRRPQTMLQNRKIRSAARLMIQGPGMSPFQFATSVCNGSADGAFDQSDIEALLK